MEETLINPISKCSFIATDRGQLGCIEYIFVVYDLGQFRLARDFMIQSNLHTT
jgi:hypothetical protein